MLLLLCLFCISNAGFVADEGLRRRLYAVMHLNFRECSTARSNIQSFKSAPMKESAARLHIYSMKVSYCICYGPDAERKLDKLFEEPKAALSAGPATELYRPWKSGIHKNTRYNLWGHILH